jgi:hypothetical protein
MKSNKTWLAGLSLLALALGVVPACGSDGTGAKGGAGGSASGSGATPGASGSGALASNCCEASTEPGCDDSNVMSCVCAQNPDCCGAAWDPSCVDLAKNSCGACGGAPVVPSDAGGPTCAVGCSEGAGAPGGGKPCNCGATCSDGYMSMDCMPAFGEPGTRCICKKMGEISGAFNSTYVGSICGDMTAVKEAWLGCKFPEASGYQLP